MPILERRGLRVSYVEVGLGDPVVLVHSGPGTAAQWRQVCEVLKDAYRLLAVNLHGVGETSSWNGPARLTLDDEAQMLGQLILTAGAPVHLVGHSYGGAVSIRLALTEQPQLHSLTLIEPMIYPLLRSAGEDALFTETMRVGEAFLAAAQNAAEDAWEQFTDYYNGIGAWAALPESARAGLLARTAVTVHRWHALMSNPTSVEDCRRLRVQTLVLCGDRTRKPERRMSEIIASVIPGCRFTFIEGSGHMSPLTHAPAVAGAIRSHLKCVGPRVFGA